MKSTSLSLPAWQEDWVVALGTCIFMVTKVTLVQTGLRETTGFLLARVFFCKHTIAGH